jgi:altronate dehydratase large subunit
MLSGRVQRRVLDTVNGDLTTAEKHKNQEFAIWRLAESM